MAQTHIGRLATELKQAAVALEQFEEFRSPVNQEVVSAVWFAAGQHDQHVRVAVREERGTFYRGWITEVGTRGGWEVLADDGELVPNVTADMFVSVLLERRPG
ncbi:hypothetical protein SEA_KELA_278 [Streptomyces phage Kela]|jgi:hypothetical protein|nr:hypothetical protein SEA_KELA_278 [Streptomyces phage Kela]